jgi:dimethylargininase
VEQHEAYEHTLSSLGLTIRRLPSLPDHPDSVFVEDTAVVLPELAVMTRPGAESRRGETASVADVLREYRRVVEIDPPGTIDGGDVLVIARTIYVGDSTRTNRDAMTRLASLVAPHGYKVLSVPVTGCLHLKSAATLVNEDAVLVNPEWIEASIFGDLKVIEVHPEEPFAANAVLTASGVIHAAGFDRTSERLERAGIRVLTVDVSELQKAEGAVTCCSILV